MALPALKKDRLYTFQEYLEIEDTLEGRYEYCEGRICAMSGTLRHSEIIANCQNQIMNQLRRKGKKCGVSPGQLKVWIDDHKTVYPDVLVYCEEPRFFEDEAGNVRSDIILNPTVIFEVTSPSSEHYDSTEKQSYYFSLHSLEEYVIVKQDATLVQHYTRVAGNKWELIVHTSLDDTIHLKTIDCDVALAELYTRVWS